MSDQLGPIPSDQPRLAEDDHPAAIFATFLRQLFGIESSRMSDLVLTVTGNIEIRFVEAIRIPSPTGAGLTDHQARYAAAVRRFIPAIISLHDQYPNLVKLETYRANPTIADSPVIDIDHMSFREQDLPAVIHHIIQIAPGARTERQEAALQQLQMLLQRLMPQPQICGGAAAGGSIGPSPTQGG